MFIRQRKNPLEEQQKTKGKEKVKASESAPITRQGYKSGMLVDELWATLSAPKTPHVTRKMLRVFPFLTKSHSHAEYLVDNNTNHTCQLP